MKYNLFLVIREEQQRIFFSIVRMQRQRNKTDENVYFFLGGLNSEALKSTFKSPLSGT